MVCPKCFSENITLLPDHSLFRRINIINKIFTYVLKVLKYKGNGKFRAGKYLLKCHNCDFKSIVQIL